MNSLFRSVKWRALKRLTPLALASAGPEKFIVSTSDLCIGETLYIKGEFDFHKFMKVMEILKGEGRRPELLLDVGANIGPICIPAVARDYVKSAIAIEPEPRNLKLLRANVALNNLCDRIEIHSAAVGAKDGETLTLDLCEGNLGDHRIHAEGETGRNGIQVQSWSLDTLCKDASDPLVWIDTQGYEGFVLQGATRLLKVTRL